MAPNKTIRMLISRLCLTSCRIGSPRVYRYKLVPLQLQIVSFERLGNQKAVRNFAGKKPTPEVVDPGWRDMLLHGLNNLGCRHRLGTQETLQNRFETEEMIAVSVGNIDRGEVLAARDDPIQ